MTFDPTICVATPMLPFKTESISTTISPERPKSTKSLFILICMELRTKYFDLQTTKRVYFQINVTEPVTDAQFFAEFRSEFKRLRGWRYYFGISYFDRCDFAKFTRYSNDGLAQESSLFPPVNHPEYEFEPILDYRRVPQIEQYEWRNRFYGDVASGRQFLALLPKRTREFEIRRHDGREEMWGLEVVLRPSDVALLVHVSVVVVAFLIVVLLLGGVAVVELLT